MNTRQLTLQLVKYHDGANLLQASESSDRTYYDILQIPESVDKDEIKTAYQKLIRLYHPDNGGTMDQFLEIMQAHKVLINPEHRKSYDNRLAFQKTSNEFLIQFTKIQKIVAEIKMDALNATQRRIQLSGGLAVGLNIAAVVTALLYESSSISNGLALAGMAFSGHLLYESIKLYMENREADPARQAATDLAESLVDNLILDRELMEALTPRLTYY